MNKLTAFAAGSVGLMLASSATVTRGQTAPSLARSAVSASADDHTMDQNLAQQISQAWIRGKDVTDAVTFQVEGENALIRGDPQQARHYFEAAEHKLAVVRPSLAGALSTK